MIRERAGRYRSERTPDEELDLLLQDLKALSPEEREAALAMLGELDGPDPVDVYGDPAPTLFERATVLEYERTPVSMETFVRDPYYLGATCDNLYPCWLQDLDELFAGDYSECIFGGSIGCGKCARYDTEVYDVSSGRRRRVDEVGDFRVASMRDGGRIGAEAATAFPSGSKPCVRITLAGGASVSVSTDHPVFTGRGWVRAGELTLGDLVATPRRMPPPDTALDITDDEVILAAYLLADGNTSQGVVSFTDACPETLAEFAEVATRLADASLNRNSGSKAEGIRAQNGAGCVSLFARGLSWFVRKYDLRSLSKHRRIPASFYGLSDRHVALFLSRFLACDSHVNAATAACVDVTLASEKLVDDLRFLYLRLGIRASKTFRTASYRGPDGAKRTFPAWRLIAYGEEAVRLLDAVGPIPGRDGACAALRARVASRPHNPVTDVVPVTLGGMRAIREELKAAGKSLPRCFLFPDGQLCGRKKMERLVEETGYDGERAWLATSDLWWCRVRSIEDDGVQPVYDLSVPSTHTFVGGGIVLHNTFAASVGVCRVLYEISCLRDPHRSYGLAPGTNIAIVGLSASESLATKVVFENIATKVGASPYFKEHFDFEQTKKELRFPKNVWVAARASTDTSALGLNCISALMDEGNFIPDVSAEKRQRFGIASRAETIYYTLKRRLKSRFARQGKLPGILFIVSSKKTRDDFTERLLREATSDPMMFAREYALWETRPANYYSTDTFQVLVGNDQTPSKILKPEEVDPFRKAPPEGTILLDVPTDFRRDFEQDLEKAIRDIAGVSTVAMSPYITRRESIPAIAKPGRKHPFSVEVYDPSKLGTFLWEALVRTVKRRVAGTYGITEEVTQPILNPTRPRFAHIDPSLTGDATGFCVAHVAGYKDVERVNRITQTRLIERAPVIVVDIILRIVPPPGDEILMGDVRNLIYAMSAKGFRITKVTLDQYQSRDGMQQLRQKGYEAELLSVDRTPDAYDVLKTALYEGRIIAYNYEPLLEELRTLERDNRSGKVDHPAHGRKDCADGLAGVVAALSSAFALQPEPLLPFTPAMAEYPIGADEQGYLAVKGGAALPPIIGASHDLDLDESWVTRGSRRHSE